MSKYKIASFPQGKYRFALYDNVERLTWQEIKKKTGCVALCNLWYFDMRTYQHDVGVMLEGKWVRSPQYTWPGICIDRDGRVTTGGTADAVWDYAASVPGRLPGRTQKLLCHLGEKRRHLHRPHRRR